MNWLSWIILGAVIIGIVLALMSVHRHQGSGCTGNCAQCRDKADCDR